MAITAATLQAYPEFAATPEATINLWIANAPAHIDATQYDDLADQATTYWVAHVLSLLKAGGGIGGGPVTAAEVGTVKVQFAAAVLPPGSSDWYTTTWGRLLLALATVRLQSADLVI
jgi:hypothetical protein